MFIYLFTYLLAGDMDVRLELVGRLDRQQRARHTFKLIAVDGGEPQLSGSVVINIIITDLRRYT